MKTYKGFNDDMTCLEFQYEQGGEYEMDGKIELCERGFHSCKMPLNVLRYYAPGENSRYFEVEPDGKIVEDSIDSKIASSKIKIGTEIGLPGLVSAQIEWVKTRTTSEHEDSKQSTVGGYGVSNVGDGGITAAGYQGMSSAGHWGISSVGDCGVSSVGNGGISSAGNGSVSSGLWHSISSVGDWGVSSTGECGISSAGAHGVSSAGDDGVSSVGNGGMSSVGDCGVSSAGSRGMSSAGKYGVAASRGSASVGKKGIACALGQNAKVRGDIGALLVIGIETVYDSDPVDWQAFIVDGKKVKANTWYTLKGGELVETE